MQLQRSCSYRRLSLACICMRMNIASQALCANPRTLARCASVPQTLCACASMHVLEHRGPPMPCVIHVFRVSDVLVGSIQPVNLGSDMVIKKVRKRTCSNTTVHTCIVTIYTCTYAHSTPKHAHPCTYTFILSPPILHPTSPPVPAHPLTASAHTQARLVPRMRSTMERSHAHMHGIQAALTRTHGTLARLSAQHPLFELCGPRANSSEWQTRMRLARQFGAQRVRTVWGPLILAATRQA